jgi:hypothetical protein
MASKKTVSAKATASAKSPRARKSAAAAAPVVASKESRKLVRDSFTMPKSEYAGIDALKSRALGFGRHVKKSEILRAGLRALLSMSDRSLVTALNAVPTLKTGRPKRGAGDSATATVKAPAKRTAAPRTRAARSPRAVLRSQSPVVDAAAPDANS